MLVFKIQFSYKGNEIKASVHELETPPKQWHITVSDEKLPAELRSTFIVLYDYENEKYVFGFPEFDTDHTFMKSLVESLRSYLWEYGWNSVNV
jgi:hypothetical protein